MKKAVDAFAFMKRKAKEKTNATQTELAKALVLVKLLGFARKESLITCCSECMRFIVVTESYKGLRALARNVLIVLATSASSERVFSNSGYIAIVMIAKSYLIQI